jgi:hypothetical protein
LVLAFLAETGVPVASRISRSALSRSRLAENAFCAISCSVIAFPAATQKHSLRPNESEEAMPAKQTSESIEAEAGLPIVERMAALGMSQAAIDHAQIWLDALSKVVSGRADELPDHLKRELAEDADAELAGAELPANIVQNHGKG